VRGTFDTSAISPKKSPAAVAAAVAGPVQEDEELAAPLALADQPLARGQLQLVGERRDLGQLLLRAACEERDGLDQLDLLVLADLPAQPHVRSLNPVPAAPRKDDRYL
jgi:hypothetical protein